MAKLEWEMLEPEALGGSAYTRSQRAKVPGGWLVQIWDYGTNSKGFSGRTSEYSMAFVPDPKHEWN
jgi:hypothetical protein